ncbi:MAG: hypothetical protein GX099_01135 [Clostridiaceae bacterium]|jgi:hypothetical protein|nr:hypothetical protein [Clostridiaceae bacterium]
MEKLNRYGRIIVIAVFIVMTLCGFLVTPDYGMPWDEVLEIRTLGSNIREYIGLFQGEKNEPTRSATGIAFPDYTENPDMDHGQSIYYPFAPALFAKESVGGQRTLMLRWHMYTFGIFMAGVIALYFVCKHLTGDWKYGLLGSLFLYLSPRFFAEGHYNSKDMVTMALVLICLALGIQMIRSGKFLFAVLFAAASAVATNMRITAVMLFGLLGLMYIINLTVEKKWSRRSFAVGVTAVLTFLGFSYLITPAAWREPLKFIEYVITRSSNYEDWPGLVFYLGTAHRPVPWHYIPVMIAVTTPILILLLWIAGNYFSIRKFIREKREKTRSTATPYYIMCMVYIWVFLLFVMIKRPILYNSWRHLYFLYGPMIVLAVGAAKSIIDLLKGKMKAVAAGAIGVHLLAMIVIIILSHPFQYVYYNPIAGTDPIQNYEFDYWNVSQVNLLMKLVDQEGGDRKISICAVDWYTSDGLWKAHNILPESYKSRILLLNSPADPNSLYGDFLMMNQSPPAMAMEVEKGWSYDKWIFTGNNLITSDDYPVAISNSAFGSDFMIVYDLRKET